MEIGRLGKLRFEYTNEECERSMDNLKHLLLKLATDERGQDLIEYALMASLLGLGTLAGLRGAKNSIGNTFNQIGNTLTTSV